MKRLGVIDSCGLECCERGSEWLDIPGHLGKGRHVDTGHNLSVDQYRFIVLLFVAEHPGRPEVKGLNPVGEAGVHGVANLGQGDPCSDTAHGGNSVFSG